MRDLSEHIMDIIQNSVRANASFVELEIFEDVKKDIYKLIFIDNGCGMSPEVLANVCDPFYTSRTTRKVGLGISLLKQNAEQAGGGLDIWSEEGKGTRLEVNFSHSNIDRPVLGNIAETMMLLVGANPEMDFIYKHTTSEGEYVFDTREIKEVLEEVALNDPNILVYLKEMINENINTII
ncbi:ATP-binding protein [Ancylomarina salipaludis]|uniref:histidine kinase n=1 Tax=Ancylomarina salipaludis TaxID=2501299 RepID=A0A4Q1JPR3_9BACT|nr:sensor histidine kinase [Ancylomarina salipaludis]RXQ97372.1 ATP-binding protein [Ancylomarina salipaludis]